MPYEPFNVSTGQALAPAGELPAELRGLSDETLLDPSKWILPPLAQFAGIGFRPVSAAPPAPTSPRPVLREIASGFAKVSGGASTAFDLVGFDSVTRRSAGWMRFYFSEAQADANYLPIPSVARGTVPVTFSVGAMTTGYCDVRSETLAGVAADGALYGLRVKRIIR